ncbi:MAG: hypothetical protein IJD37_06445 [Clostridia bacterium]|nr:hypothetical protein [Clostridia bacterium]
MSDFCYLDEINMPIYICDSEWRVTYRNRACKRFTPSPRVNGQLSKRFIDKGLKLFPKKNGGIEFIMCMIGDSYKSALCFEYNSSAVVIFPTLLEYDLLFGEYSSRVKKDFADVFRGIFKELSLKDRENSDRYGVIEKLRSYYFGAIENYVAMALLNSEKRVLGSISRLYEFFIKNIVKLSNRTGLKIETQLSSIDEVGENIYTDTLYFTFVLAGILLFGVEISEDKKCIIEPVHLGRSVRHTIRFTCKCPELYGKSGSELKAFKENYPIGYFNVIPYEAMCAALGWRLCYELTNDEALNCTVYFDIDNDNEMLFRSSVGESKLTPEELVADILSKVFII